MDFSIHYRSIDTMHPALAFEIKEHAEGLIALSVWSSCEPISLRQQCDGHLIGQSKLGFFRAEADAYESSSQNLPDGTLLTLAEVLCLLSREYGIDWLLGHDYEPDWIGRISDGEADLKLIEQLETLASIGNLLDESLDQFWEYEFEDSDTEDHSIIAMSHYEGTLRISEEDLEVDDGGPRLLKFPVLGQGNS